MSHRQDTCAGDSTSMYHSQICTKTPVFVSVFAARMVLSAQELFAMKKMATAGMGNKKIATALGSPQSTMKRWLQRLRSEGEMVSHNVGRPRGAEAGLCLLFSFFARLISLESVRDLRACSGADDKIRSACSCQASLINAWVATVPCCAKSPVFANVCKRLTPSAAGAAVQEHMKAEHWPAKQVTCGTILCFFSANVILWPSSQVKNQHLTALNKRRRLGVVHIDVGAPWRNEVAASRHHSCKTHNSLCFHAILCIFFKPLCNRSSQFFVVQFQAFPSQFLKFYGGFQCLLVCVSVHPLLE